MVIPSDGAPYMITPSSTSDFNAATGAINNLVNQGARFVAVSGIGLLAPGDTSQLNDGGPSAARTARATCRLDCISTPGAAPAAALTVIATRTSRGDAAATGSIRPDPVGTNSSGPRSPTV